MIHAITTQPPLTWNCLDDWMRSWWLKSHWARGHHWCYEWIGGFQGKGQSALIWVLHLGMSWFLWIRLQTQPHRTEASVALSAPRRGWVEVFYSGIFKKVFEFERLFDGILCNHCPTYTSFLQLLFLIWHDIFLCRVNRFNPLHTSEVVCIKY